jgi:mRNA interferase ChpB
MDRGDVFLVELDPTTGREQAGRRYVLVTTVADFNRLGTPIVVPITRGGGFARVKGFAVSLTGTGTKTEGVVLCHQPRAMDLEHRRARFVEKMPEYIMDEVLMRLQALFE